MIFLYQLFRGNESIKTIADDVKVVTKQWVVVFRALYFI